MNRQAEHERIKSILSDLEGAGIALYKLALILDRPYNTVKHWKETGRVESHDAKALSNLHQAFARPVNCQIDPQYCKVSHLST